MNPTGASHQSSKDYKEFEASVQSTLISKAQVTPRRLNIFESIANSEDLADEGFPTSIRYEKGKRSSRDHKSVNGILKRSLIELTETLRTLESDDPFKAMRVPVPVIPMQSPESLLVFQSLLKMLSTPTECHSPPEWQQYLIESISNQQCSVLDLCREFQQNFKCDEEGHLSVILLDNQGSFDHLNLLMIPDTVRTLSLRQCKLKTVSEWNDLKGKSLSSLRVDRNADLELNFDGLRGEQGYLPLEHLDVAVGAIRKFFGERDLETEFSRIGRWMRASTLTAFRLRCRRPGGNDVCFKTDGSWTVTRHSGLGSVTMHVQDGSYSRHRLTASEL